MLWISLTSLFFSLVTPFILTAQVPPFIKKTDPAAKWDSADTVGQVIQPDKVRRSDTSMAMMLTRLEEYAVLLNKDLATLKRGFDTSEISARLPEINQMVESIAQNIEGDANANNVRNLNTTRVALQQVELWLKKYQDQLKGYNQILIEISNNLHSVQHDSLLMIVPEDSLLFQGYLKKLTPLQAKWKQADSILNASLKRIGIVQNEVAYVYFRLSDQLETVQGQINNYQKRFFRRDLNYLWEPSQTRQEKNLLALARDGMARNLALAILFIYTNWWWLALIALIFVLIFVLNRYNLRRLQESGRADILEKLHFVKRSNFRSVLLIFFTLSPFVLKNPPAGLVQIFWIFVTISAIRLRWIDWPPSFRKHIFAFLVIFGFFAIDSFILESSSVERMILLLLNAGAVVLGWYMYREVGRDKSRYHSLMDESILIFLVINILALLANATGRLNLARVLSNSSVLSISLLLALQLIREIILESLYLHAETHKNSGFAGFLDFNQQNEKYRKLLGAATIFIWLLSLAWSMNFYDQIYDWGAEFLNQERNLGKFNFSYGSILIFIVVIWVAVLAARLVSMVVKTESTGFPVGRKAKSGSWLLFAKLGIYTIGLIIAFAAAGIPMDKFAVVLGALSVGIGFGLQNVVNNLVSGIILAIEKPMEIGDVIELGSRMGTVKEIGFRSSQIATYDGSVIIVPNGDFISQQLINWTHSNNNYRRVDITIGVPYGSDLEKIKGHLNHIIQNHPEVAPYPAPIVIVSEFAASSVNLRALFWTAEFDKWMGLKSSVLQQVYETFASEGIEIPYPQADLHLRSVDPTLMEALRPPRPDAAKGP
jgi:small-conductance mechanosensitive channel